jgi:hypothetical protein
MRVFLTSSASYIPLSALAFLLTLYGAGGVRKLRWAAPGRGKRGGYRVIYYVRHVNGVIWMLTMYPKNVADNISARALQQIKKEVDDG